MKAFEIISTVLFSGFAGLFFYGFRTFAVKIIQRMNDLIDVNTIQTEQIGRLFEKHDTLTERVNTTNARVDILQKKTEKIDFAQRVCKYRPEKQIQDDK
jgi:hypothetical protein